MTTTKQIAIDCKVFTLTAVAFCEASGVKYAPGQTFRVANKRIRDYLVAAGAVMDESDDPIAEVSPAATVPVAATPPAPPKRVTRRKK